jgi:hypothetical protein
MATLPVVTSKTPIAPSEYGQQAINLMIKVRDLTKEIDGFRYAAKGRRTKIGTTSSLPEEFLQQMAVACDASPAFSVKAELTGTEIRNGLDFAREFTNLGKETHLVAKGVEDTVAEILAEIGKRALAAYKVAQNLNEPGQKETILPHLVEMQRTLGRGRPKKRKTDATGTPVKKGDAK